MLNSTALTPTEGSGINKQLALKSHAQLSQTFRPLLMTRAQQAAYEQQVALEMQITITTNSCQVLQIFHCCSTLACCTCAAVVT